MTFDPRMPFNGKREITPAVVKNFSIKWEELIDKIHWIVGVSMAT